MDHFQPHNIKINFCLFCGQFLPFWILNQAIIKSNPHWLHETRTYQYSMYSFWTQTLPVKFKNYFEILYFFSIFLKLKLRCEYKPLRFDGARYASVCPNKKAFCTNFFSNFPSILKCFWEPFKINTCVYRGHRNQVSKYDNIYNIIHDVHNTERDRVTSTVPVNKCGGQNQKLRFRSW